MAIQRGFDDQDPVRPVGDLAGTEEERRNRRGKPVAYGTLACSACDAPVVPAHPMSPAASISCSFCDHTAPVRDFLSLAPPRRPTRVVVRVVGR